MVLRQSDGFSAIQQDFTTMTVCLPDGFENVSPIVVSATKSVPQPLPTNSLVPNSLSQTQGTDHMLSNEEFADLAAFKLGRKSSLGKTLRKKYNAVTKRVSEERGIWQSCQLELDRYKLAATEFSGHLFVMTPSDWLSSNRYLMEMNHKATASGVQFQDSDFETLLPNVSHMEKYFELRRKMNDVIEKQAKATLYIYYERQYKNALIQNLSV